MHYVYFLSRFPHYSETFIQEEIDSLIKSGNSVQIIALNFKNPKTEKYTVTKSTINPFALLAAILKKEVNSESIVLSTHAVKTILSAIWHDKASIHKYILLWLNLDYLALTIHQTKQLTVVNHFLFRSSVAGYLVAHKLAYPLSLKLHTKSSTLGDSVLKRMFEFASEISAISSNCASHFSSRFGNNKKIQIARQYINKNALVNLQHLKKTSGKFVIICIGRLVPKKGFEQFIQAYVDLSTELKQNVCISFIGEGKELNNLKSIVENKGLEDVVKFHGRLNHLNTIKHLRKASLLVVPSVVTEFDQDGIPTVIPEAMMLKTLILASDVGGISELISDNQTGFLYNSTSKIELTEKLANIIKNYNTFEAITESAYSKVLNEYQPITS